MNLKSLLQKKNISMYSLSKKTGIPQTTIRDICNGRVILKNCSADKVHRISKVLVMSMEELLDYVDNDSAEDLDIFRGNVQHRLKQMGDLKYIEHILVSNEIQYLFDNNRHAESLYLLALLDYLSRINGIPICGKYNKLRKCKLKNVLYPSSIITLSIVQKSDDVKKSAIKESIPEFIRFNIVEKEVRNVF